MHFNVHVVNEKLFVLYEAGNVIKISVSDGIWDHPEKVTTYLERVSLVLSFARILTVPGQEPAL